MKILPSYMMKPAYLYPKACRPTYEPNHFPEMVAYLNFSYKFPYANDSIRATSAQQIGVRWMKDLMAAVLWGAALLSSTLIQDPKITNKVRPLAALSILPYALYSGWDRQKAYKAVRDSHVENEMLDNACHQLQS